MFVVAFTLACTAASAEPLNLSCTGSMIDPSAVSQSEKTLRMSLGPSSKITLDLGQGKTQPRLVSDNKIQLKFQTKDFVGEFFRYTNDLFLIYKSGHLARMTCKAES
jgi:hypothetical protein